MKERCVLEGDTRMKFGRSKFVIEGFFPTMCGEDKSQNEIKISETKGCVMYD